MIETCAVIVAAGSSSRMQSEIPKILLPLNGKTVIRWTLEAFEQAAVDAVVVVCRGEDLEAMQAQTAGLLKIKAIVPGGADRQESVTKGVQAAGPCRYLAIHDGARPLITAKKINEACEACKQWGAATLAVRVKDTIKTADADRLVLETPDRNLLWQIQTPQVFIREQYLEALRLAHAAGSRFTDDCQLIEAQGQRVYLQEGDYQNLKLTTPEDLLLAEATLKERRRSMRIGHGYDVHKLVSGRALIIGGVQIPYEKGLLGHSDADVLLHAISDALLGAAGLGDIGGMFPDTDPQYKGADSLLLLRQVVCAVKAKAYHVGNVDCTIIAQAPKLKPYLPAMAEKIAAACGISAAEINIKATTEEELGFTGRKEGISAHAVCLLEAD